MVLTHVDLFSGIGGFSIAAGWAGYKTVLHCEIEEFPTAVLQKHWPDVPVHRDVRTLHLSDYGINQVDLLTGGFPCQPFSFAGKRKGVEDDRHLWPEMRRIAEESRPHFVVAENVRGLLSSGHEQICAELEEIGYEVETIVLPALSVNAPHHERYRVWILGHDVSHASCQGLEVRGWQSADPVEYSQREERNAWGIHHRERSSEDVSNSSSELGGTSWDDLLVAPLRCSGSRWEEGAVAEPSMGQSTDGFSSYLSRPHMNLWDGNWGQDITKVFIPTTTAERSLAKHQLKALGNAVIPQVAFVILEAISNHVQ